jgi:hypothetical protein
MKMLQIWGAGTTVLIFAHTALADWQTTASTVILGTQLPTTNLVVTKKGEQRVRVDILPTAGFLSFEDKAEQIQLDHQRRTFVRVPIQNIPNPEPVPPGLAFSRERVSFDGQSAEMFRWTNGIEQHRAWIAPLSRFVTLTNPPIAQTNQAGSPVPGGVGSVFGSNSIVIATEQIMPVPIPNSASSGTGATGEVVTLIITNLSRLLSIIETNFPDSEFEIPAGYRDATGEPPPDFRPPPGIFADKINSQRGFEARRKEYEKGRPVLTGPPSLRKQQPPKPPDQKP